MHDMTTGEQFANETNHGTTRRQLLTGAAAATAVLAAGTAAAATAPTSAELEQLIAAVESATKHGEEVVRAYGAVEHPLLGRKDRTPEEQAALQAAGERCSEAHQAENEALHALLSYRPKGLSEIRVRSDYLLRQSWWFDGAPTEDELLALIMSTSSMEG